MKKMFMAAIAIVGIIAVQMVLSEIFTWRVGEIFTEVSLGILFYYSVCRLLCKKRKAAGQDSSCG